MSLLPRFVTGEFAPLFRLMDDYASHQLTRSGFPAFPATTLRSFQPRFDVKEGKDSYTLEGELPGIHQKDVNIEFTDSQTLSIRGRSEHTRESGDGPTEVDAAPETKVIADDTASQTSNYRKPYVEDEDDTSTTMTGATPAIATPIESVASKTPEPAPAAEKPSSQPSSRYWVSERSVGEFQRTFNFPSRIDQDNVKASLKNGILSILVPKAQAPTSRRINIE